MQRCGIAVVFPLHGSIFVPGPLAHLPKTLYSRAIEKAKRFETTSHKKKSEACVYLNFISILKKEM